MFTFFHSRSLALNQGNLKFYHNSDKQSRFATHKNSLRRYPRMNNHKLCMIFYFQSVKKSHSQLSSHSVINGNHRKLKGLIRRHGTQPDHTSSCFFSTTDKFSQQVTAVFMQFADQISAIIHRKMRPEIQCLRYMPVIGTAIFVAYGKGRDLIMFYQGGSDIILCAERIAGA